MSRFALLAAAIALLLLIMFFLSGGTSTLTELDCGHKMLCEGEVHQ